MKGVYIQKGSPYYWIRYYDRTVKDDKQRRKSINTKIRVTDADRRRKAEGKTLIGTPEIRDLSNRFRVAIAERNIEDVIGQKLITRRRIAEGLEDFFIEHPNLKPASENSYRNALDRFEDAVGKDRYIHELTARDYYHFVKFLNAKGYSEASKSSFTKHLSVIFRFFVEQKYLEKTIIKIIPSPPGLPDPIPADDLVTIIDFYRTKSDTYKTRNVAHSPADVRQQYHFVKMMLLTGFRQSTVLELTWDKINYRDNHIIAKNVKGKKIFLFPIHQELQQLLKEMDPDRKKKGRLFTYKGKDSLSFWDRDLKKMVEAGDIQRKYQMYQLRDTFASLVANSGVDMSIVQDLLNHSSIRITKEHYSKHDVDRSGSLLSNIRFLDRR